LIFLRSIFLPLLAFAFKNKRETQHKWVIRMAVFFSLVLHRGEAASLNPSGMKTDDAGKATSADV
ncbi:MAG: hypothetical protein ACK5YR_24930, partial [Pirellula sp.]